MTFSKEDKAAWLNSEVMRELEKLGEEVLSGPPAEAYQPIGEIEDKGWEDESPEDRLANAAEEFNEPSLKEELVIAYNKSLLNGIEKVAHRLSDMANIKAAYRVEQSLKEIKALLRKEK